MMRLDIYLYKFQNNKLMERTFVFKNAIHAIRTYVHTEITLNCLLVCFVVK